MAVLITHCPVRAYAIGTRAAMSDLPGGPDNDEITKVVGQNDPSNSGIEAALDVEVSRLRRKAKGHGRRTSSAFESYVDSLGLP